MKLYINESDFIDIIEINNRFHCQIKELNDAVFLCRGSILDDKSFDTPVVDDEIYSKTNAIFNSLEEVIQYHTTCVIEHYSFEEKNN